MSFINRSVECLGRIVRIDETMEDGLYTGKYNIGVYFLNISPDDKIVIDKFIYEERKRMKEKIL